MRINEKDELIEKCEKINFDDCSNIFLMRPSYEKYPKIEKCEKNDFDGYPR